MLQYQVKQTLIMSNGETLTVDVLDNYQILLGGDLLSSFRAREVQRIMAFSDQPQLRCEGLIPVSEDYHTKLCLLEVSLFYFKANLYIGYMEKILQYVFC